MCALDPPPPNPLDFLPKPLLSTPLAPSQFPPGLCLPPHPLPTPTPSSYLFPPRNSALSAPSGTSPPPNPPSVTSHPLTDRSCLPVLPIAHCSSSPLPRSLPRVAWGTSPDRARPCALARSPFPSVCPPPLLSVAVAYCALPPRAGCSLDCLCDPTVTL